MALYGVARLIEQKEQEKAALDTAMSTEEIIRDREELSEQIRALKELQEMAASYGFDISGPARNRARSRAMALLRRISPRSRNRTARRCRWADVSTFLDIYFERDLAEGTLTEEQAQEIIDDFVIKLRIVRFLRTPEYDELFAGDPTWVTESIGGMGDDGRSLVTKTSFRFLQTLYNLGPAPEPNLTIWYSPRLPDGFPQFRREGRDRHQLDAIRERRDHAAAHGATTARLPAAFRRCWSASRCSFSARAPTSPSVCSTPSTAAAMKSPASRSGRPSEPVEGEYLEFDDVVGRFEKMMEWLAGVYVNAMNVIHYMHDKYAYERIEMALHDYAPVRTMAFGIAGLSVVADSLSAMRYARVKVIRDETGLITDYQTEGEFPKFGNNDNRVDQLAAWLVSARS